MFAPHEGIGERGERVPGPPWILGHRGSPREAPENTEASLRRAIELGLDGVEYDVQRCATGEAVLLHDETLDRTTDAHGAVALRTLPELFGIDAGGWFHRAFEGEPLPLLGEVLDLPGNEAGAHPQHMIEVKDPDLVAEVTRQVGERGERLSVRIASFHRSVCLEARDAGLPAMLLAEHATEEDRVFVRDERIAAHGTGPGGWRTGAGEREWPCERWSWSVDEPRDLLEACRMPLNGFNTNEPLRALATRALCRLAPHDSGPYPVAVRELEVSPDGLGEGGGEWAGRWSVRAEVRNPFAFEVRATSLLMVRGGAFEVEPTGAVFDLEPGRTVEVPFELEGGSFSPGSDPLFAVRFSWGRGPGRPAEALVLDAPLHRVRTLVASEDARRLTLLRESRGDPPASMTVRRRGNQLLVAVENAGGLEHPRTRVRIGSREVHGGRGVVVSLPTDFDIMGEGIPFSCGVEGNDPRRGGTRRLRRWAGGLPAGLESGVPGRLRPR